MNVDLPFLAEGIEGGDVVQLLVKEGDQVTEGQALLELETEKATVPVPSPAAGRVARLLVRQSEHIRVGQTLLVLDHAQNEDTTSSQPGQAEHSRTTQQTTKRAEAQPHPVGRREDEHTPPAQPPPTVASEPPTSQLPTVEAPSERVLTIPASPSVRRLARELGLDLAHVKGSEAGGRITAEDIKTHVRNRSQGRESQPAKGGSRAGGTEVVTRYGTERREALSSLRRKIATTLAEAWTRIPHVHQFQEADITELLSLKERYASKFIEKGTRLTLTSLLIKAVTHALKLYPELNATLDATTGEVIYKDYYNIGVAVDTPAGLIVPVVHQVDKKDLLQISLELADLAERTRNRQVQLEELRGATFSISNMGGIGAGPFTPIIKPPEVGILGVGRGRRVPVLQDGHWVPRTLLPLCLAYDHRLIDGSTGARFTNEIVRVLEDFQAMFLGL